MFFFYFQSSRFKFLEIGKKCYSFYCFKNSKYYLEYYDYLIFVEEKAMIELSAHYTDSIPTE